VSLAFQITPPTIRVPIQKTRERVETFEARAGRRSTLTKSSECIWNS
jgi:hypothetical protein